VLLAYICGMPPKFAMHKVFTFLFLISFSRLTAQIYPKEGSKLNYRIVGFSFPVLPATGNYTIQIANGNQTTQSGFKKNILKSVNADKNKIIIEVPTFGTDYSWRVIDNQHNTLFADSIHHFSTSTSRNVNSDFRITVLENSGKYNNDYVFMDGTCVLYDMLGQPVWFLPETEYINPASAPASDLKLTPQGTITFLTAFNIYEVNYNGDILWQGSKKGVVSGDSTENFNHEFTRLANGHYMAAGNEIVTLKESNSITHFGDIIEYDPLGAIVWSWRSSPFFLKQSGIDYDHPPKDYLDVHLNAFYFDEKERMVYVSFKNISVILKVKYPEGNVVNVYGNIPTGGVKPANDLFCGQHSCRSSANGDLYLYNNNTCHPGSMPTVLMMKQPVNKSGSLEKVWEYTCNISDTLPQKQSDELHPVSYSFPKGGNVIELPDRSLFVNMCGAFGKSFIITLNRKIEWSARLESWNEQKKDWEGVNNYRASIITSRKDLERLIWNSEK